VVLSRHPKKTAKTIRPGGAEDSRPGFFFWNSLALLNLAASTEMRMKNGGYGVHGISPLKRFANEENR
jgi:hypothetical protein